MTALASTGLGKLGRSRVSRGRSARPERTASMKSGVPATSSKRAWSARVANSRTRILQSLVFFPLVPRLTPLLGFPPLIAQPPRAGPGPAREGLGGTDVRDGAPDRRRGTRTVLGLLGVAAALALIALPARAADDPWSEDARWVSMRIGSAGSGAKLAANGNYGYGFGYSWFLGNELAWSATVQHDVLGRYGDASEIDVPITVEFTKHFHVSDPARPYLGGGWGIILHKTYRTGADESGFRQGIYLAT